MRVAHKIWFGSALLLLGYVFNVGLGYLQNDRTAARLERAGSTDLIAVKASQHALGDFEDIVRVYQEAVLFGDEDKLSEASAHRGRALTALREIDDLDAIDAGVAEHGQALTRAIENYTARADDIYGRMMSGDFESVSADDRAALAQAGEQIQEDLATFVELCTSTMQQNLRRAMDSNRTQANVALAVFLLVTTASLFGLQFTLRRYVTVPLDLIIGRLRDIGEGEGDLTQRVAVDSQDEMGELASAFNTFVVKMQEAVRAVAQSTGVVSESAETLHGISQQMQDTARATQDRSRTTAQRSEQVNTSALSAATSAEEMSASIDEIAQNASRAAQETGHAVTNVQEATQRISELDAAGTEINSVIKVIESIAEQTNLLALNATIEAARAGEAGKGFAVVANEVKELAGQTARATEESAEKIRFIQESTQRSVEAMDNISQVINRINDIATTIAAAVEEQSAVTREITQNVNLAAEDSSRISANANEVASLAEEAASRANTTAQAADGLTGEVAHLQELVSQFRY